MIKRLKYEAGGVEIDSEDGQSESEEDDNGFQRNSGPNYELSQ